MAKKIFITHSFSDNDFAKRLADDLAKCNLTVFIDLNSIVGGDTIPEKISQGLKECDVYIPILTRASLKSKWCNFEINTAITLGNQSGRNGCPRIIPVLNENLATDEIPTLLASSLYISFVNPNGTSNYQPGFDKLLAALLAKNLATSPLPMVNTTSRPRSFTFNVPMILLVLIAVISVVLVPIGMMIASLASSQCAYVGATDVVTLANLINAEAQAVNAKDFGTIQKIFDSNARIRNRMNDRIVLDKTMEWVSSKAYYQDYLFATFQISSSIHSTIKPVGPGIGAAEAWMTSASSGYYNGTKFDNPPGSDHWRFIKNSNGCWVIAEFDFNASHIPFP